MSGNAGTDDRNTDLLVEDFKALGVTVEEMEERVNIDPEKEAAARGGEAKGPIMSQQGHPAANLTEDKKGDQADDKGESEEPYDLVPLTEEVIEEAYRRVRQKRGARVRMRAKKAHRYYVAHRASILRGGRKYRKKAVSKRKAARRAKAKARFGAPRKGMRMQWQDMDGADLASRLRTELSESKVDQADVFDDIKLLEDGALIAAMLGDRFEDIGMDADAETARTTSDNLIALIERVEKENKVAVTDEDMVPAVKAVAVVIDHFEKLGEASNDLPLGR